MGEIRRLWTGEMPLLQAFWTYAVLIGVVVNLLTSGLFMVLLVAERPIAALIVGYGLSVPYNVLVVVGVWRAADRYDGDPARADLARFVTLVGMILLTVT